MEIIFTNPEYLWLLLVVPAIVFVHFFSFKYTKQRALKFANFEAISQVSGGKILTKNLLMLAIRVLMVTLLIVSIAGATVWYEGETHNYDVVLAMDASGSMLVDDFYPNRLNASKYAAETFIDNLLPGDEVGVISFAGVSFIEQDISGDLAKTKNTIEKIDIRAVGGTALGDAIITSTNLLVKSKKTKVIVLVTDGANNMGVSLNTSIDYAKENNVIIHTIGIGTEEGGYLMNESADYLVLGKEDLKSIAQQTGGKFFFSENQEKLSEAFKEITQKTENKIPLDLSPPLLTLAIVLFLFDIILQGTIYRVIPG